MSNNHYNSHYNSHYNNHYKWLEAGRDDATLTAFDRASSTRLRQRLVAEIQQLESELDALLERDDPIDRSTQQTCREMIHSRRQLFIELCQ